MSQERVCGGVVAGLGWAMLDYAGLCWAGLGCAGLVGSASVRFIIEFVAA